MAAPAASLPDLQAAHALFLSGLATGLSLLLMTAFLSLSPRWLRWLLLACGALLIGRYLAMAAFAITPHPSGEAAWNRCWLAASIGMTFPAWSPSISWCATRP